MSKNETQSKSRVENILADVASFVETERRIPTGVELKEQFGLTKKTVEHHFSNYEKLTKAARAAHPKAFQNVFMPEDFSTEAFAKVAKDIKKYKRFVVTTAICGDKVNREFLKALKNYCQRRKAKLLIIPSGHDLIKLDSILKGEAIVTHELYLNSNIRIDPVVLNPKVLRPMSGLGRIGQRSCSTIYAAPKLTKESIATDTGKLPHLIMTTGAITDANYVPRESIMKKKVDHVAYNDHDLASIIIEIADGQFFFQREMQADLDGSVVDLTIKGPVRYYADGKVKAEKALNFNVPDWHHGETAEDCYQIWPELAELSKAESVSLHDVLSYRGHSHHTKDNEILSAQIEEAGVADPVAEFQGLADDFQMWLKKVKNAQFYIVASNHPEHVDKAITEGTLNQPQTKRTYLELALAMLDGNDPLQWGLKNYAKFSSSRFTFLSRDDRHVLRNKQGEMALHNHGDRSKDGSRNSGQSAGVVESLGCAVINHLHSPKIIAGGTLGGKGNGTVWVGGTSTVCDGDERPGYSLGFASSWLKTATVVYGSKNGRFLRQQITLIGGQWCLDSGRPKMQKDVRAKRHKEMAEILKKRRVRGLY